MKQLTVCSRTDAETRLKGIHDVTALISIHSPPSSPWAQVSSIGCAPVAGYYEFKGPKLALCFDDVTSHRPGYEMPMAFHVQTAMQWAAEYVPPDAHLLVHCMQGASRSPAIAFVVLCHRLGLGKEAEAQEAVLKANRLVAPNMRIIKLGDSLLRRDGALVRLWEDWKERQRSSGLLGSG